MLLLAVEMWSERAGCSTSEGLLGNQGRAAGDLVLEGRLRFVLAEQPFQNRQKKFGANFFFEKKIGDKNLAIFCSKKGVWAPAR